MKIGKRILGALLSVVFVFTSMPCIVLADSISISGITDGGVYDAEEAITVKCEVPEGYTNVAAYNGTKELAEASVFSDAANVTLPANSLTPGINKLSFVASGDDKTDITTESVVYAYKEISSSYMHSGVVDFDSLVASGKSAEDVEVAVNTGGALSSVLNTNGAYRFFPNANLKVVPDDAEVSLKEDTSGNVYLYNKATSTPTSSKYDWEPSRFTFQGAAAKGIISVEMKLYVPDSETLVGDVIYYTGIDSSQYSDTKTNIATGEWNTIRKQFNLDKKTYTSYVTNSKGTFVYTSNWNCSEITTANQFRYDIRLNSGKWIGIDDVCARYIDYTDEKMAMIPVDGEYTNEVSVSISTYGGKSVSIYVDDALKASGNIDGSGNYTTTLTNLGTGYKTIRADVTFDTGLVLTKYANVNIKKLNNKGIGGASANVEDFNELPDALISETVINSSADINSTLISATAWKGNNAASTTWERSVQRVTGKSANAGDYALRIQNKNLATSAKTSWSDCKLILNVSDTSAKILGGRPATGKLICKFDINVDKASDILYVNAPYYLWNNKGKFTDGGKIAGTTLQLTAEKWHSVKLEYDIATAIWTIYLDDNAAVTKGAWTITSGNPSSNCDTIGSGYVEVATTRSSCPAGDTYGFALDNAAFYYEVPETYITNVTCNSAAVENGILSDGQKTVSVNMSAALTDPEITVYKDGTETDAYSANYNTETNAVTLSGNFVKNSVVRIDISGITYTMYITDDTGVFYKLSDIDLTSGLLSASLEAVALSNKESPIKAILALYDSNELLAVDVIDYDVNEGHSLEALSLKASGASKAKVFLWYDMTSIEPIINAALSE